MPIGEPPPGARSRATADLDPLRSPRADARLVAGPAVPAALTSVGHRLEQVSEMTELVFGRLSALIEKLEPVLYPAAPEPVEAHIEEASAHPQPWLALRLDSLADRLTEIGVLIERTSDRVGL
jgi:hypothetical protein